MGRDFLVKKELVLGVSLVLVLLSVAGFSYLMSGATTSTQQITGAAVTSSLGAVENLEIEKPNSQIDEIVGEVNDGSSVFNKIKKIFSKNNLLTGLAIGFNDKSGNEGAIGVLALPVVSNVAFTTTDQFRNTTVENLTLTYDVSDGDGDNVYNITNWYLNGSSILLLNLPFEKVDGTDYNNTRDYSGTYNKNATEEGDVYWNDTNGSDGYGVYIFDGNDDYLEITDLTDDLKNFSRLDGFTFLLDIYMDTDSAGYDNFISQKDGDGFSYDILTYGVFECSNKLATYMDGTPLCGSTTLSKGEWYQVGLRWDGSTRSLIVNGQIDASEGKGDLDSGGNGNIILGASKSGTTNELKGRLDNVLFFNRSLSDEQIQKLYENNTRFWSAEETEIGDNWSISITPNDGDKDGVTVFSNNVTIVDNLLPIYSNIIINSTNDATNDTDQNITITYDMNEANNDPVQNMTNWYKNGESMTLLNLYFEKNKTGVNLVDYSGYGFGQAVFGNPSYDESGGYLGSGAYPIDKSATEDYLLVNLSENFQNFSFFTWFKTKDATSPSSDPTIISRLNGGGGEEFRIYFYQATEDDIRVVLNEVEYTFDDNIDLFDQQWHSLALLYNYSNLSLYIDGVQYGDTQGPEQELEFNQRAVAFGKNLASGNYFEGTFDNVKLFNLTITHDQVIALNNSEDIIVSSMTDVSENYSVCITGNDGIEDGLTYCSENLTVASDSTPPSVTIAHPENNGIYRIENVDLNFTVTDDSEVDSCWYSFDDGASNNTIAGCNNLTISPGNGTFTLSFNANDTLGNQLDEMTNLDFIINTLPQLNSWVFNSTDGTNDTFQNFTVYTQTSDAEEDSISVLNSWKINGGPAMSLYLPFERINGTSFNNTKDYSGNNYPVIENVTAQWDANDGYLESGAYRFQNPNTSHLKIEHSALGNPEGDFSLSAWVKLNESTLTETNIVINKLFSPNGFALAYVNPSERGGIAIANGTDINIITGDSAWQEDEWHFMVMTFNSQTNNSSYYEDGVYKSSIVSNLNFSDVDWTIGSDIYGLQVFNGTIDEVRVWDILLSNGQINVMYENKTNLIESNQLVVGTNWSSCITLNDGLEDSSTTCTNNITVVEYNDTVLPTIVWNAPLNDSFYNETEIELDYTVDDNIMVDSCWYSLNFGITNNSIENCDTEHIEPGRGTFDLTFYVNDTSENRNINQLQANFTINSFPVVDSLDFNSSNGNFTNFNLTSYPYISDVDDQILYNFTTWYLNGSKNMMLHLPFERINASLVNNTHDYSGQDHLINVSNNATWLESGGYLNTGAYDLQNDSAVVNINPTGDRMTSPSFSISFWVKLNELKTQGILGRNNGGTGWRVFVKNESGNLEFDTIGEVGNLVSTTELNVGNWYHITATHDNETNIANLYVNGSLEATANSVDIFNHHQHWLILGEEQTNWFNGTIDNVLMFNRSIGADQVQSIYQNFDQVIVANETNIGDNWSICVTPNDGLENGAQVCSLNITILTCSESWSCSSWSSCSGGSQSRTCTDSNACGTEVSKPTESQSCSSGGGGGGGGSSGGSSDGDSEVDNSDDAVTENLGTETGEVNDDDLIRRGDIRRGGIADLIAPTPLPWDPPEFRVIGPINGDIPDKSVIMPPGIVGDFIEIDFDLISGGDGDSDSGSSDDSDSGSEEKSGSGSDSGSGSGSDSGGDSSGDSGESGSSSEAGSEDSTSGEAPSSDSGPGSSSGSSSGGRGSSSSKKLAVVDDVYDSRRIADLAREVVSLEIKNPANKSVVLVPKVTQGEVEEIVPVITRKMFSGFASKTPGCSVSGNPVTNTMLEASLGAIDHIVISPDTEEKIEMELSAGFSTRNTEALTLELYPSDGEIVSDKPIMTQTINLKRNVKTVSSVVPNEESFDIFAVLSKADSSKRIKSSEINSDFSLYGEGRYIEVSMVDVTDEGFMQHLGKYNFLSKSWVEDPRVVCADFYGPFDIEKQLEPLGDEGKAGFLFAQKFDLDSKFKKGKNYMINIQIYDDDGVLSTQDFLVDLDEEKDIKHIVSSEIEGESISGITGNSIAITGAVIGDVTGAITFSEVASVVYEQTEEAAYIIYQDTLSTKESKMAFVFLLLLVIICLLIYFIGPARPVVVDTLKGAKEGIEMFGKDLNA